MKHLLATIAATVFLLIAVRPARSQDVDLARDLAEEGVSNEAKIEFVKVLHDPAKRADYAEAHYYLGDLSFKEKNYERALLHWGTLVKDFSESAYAQKARDQIRIAYLLLSKQQEVTGENLEISSLFENADFLVGQPLKVSIDTSYLSTGDLAIECLEEVVAKFPKSQDAPRALFREALVYHGWGKNGIGQYSTPEGYGFAFYTYYRRDNKMSQAYIAKMVDVLSRLDKLYPDSPYRIPVAFLIGQAYWSSAGGKTDEGARSYWNKVLSMTQDDTANTYRQIAGARAK